MKYVISYEDFTSQILENNSFISREFVMLREDYDTNMTVLKNAIDNKFVCSIYYKGEIPGVIDDGYRKIEPHALGYNSRGNTVLRAWLISGKSRKGKIDPKQVPGWRLFRVDRIFNISTSLGTYNFLRKGYNSKDKGMVEILYAAK